MAGILVCAGVGVAEALGVGVGVNVGIGAGFSAGFTAIPLFQTSLLPCFTHVYFIFETVLVVPALVHLVPAMDAEKAGAAEITIKAVNNVEIDLPTRAMSMASGYIRQEGK